MEQTVADSVRRIVDRALQNFTNSLGEVIEQSVELAISRKFADSSNRTQIVPSPPISDSPTESVSQPLPKTLSEHDGVPGVRSPDEKEPSSFVIPKKRGTTREAKDSLDEELELQAYDLLLNRNGQRTGLLVITNSKEGKSIREYYVHLIISFSLKIILQFRNKFILNEEKCQAVRDSSYNHDHPDTVVRSVWSLLALIAPFLNYLS